ncbi:S-formylglutathione hydrolase [Legionella fairfieldensis]|uniref:S-formylglutathione hydrolase n=1 Tax=Legionella fairfieldensis TaxID=45064 RepID=UPI00048B17A9|nr:S-formylglutathione hydrolase [Legionella fairfieldensis]
MTFELIEEHRCFEGLQRIYSHESLATKCTMRFALFLPPQATRKKVPVLYWLSGLTCNEQNFITKAGAQRVAAELGLALVAPDTSPRGVDISDEQIDYDFGPGASFYIDALQKPWAKHYQMARYISEELPSLLNQHFPLDARRTGIFGHSMGGHGALTLAIKNPGQYSSVSAFAPVCAPMQCPWGRKAFTGYLGTDQQVWKNYDACELIKNNGWPHGPVLIDQGTKDPFLKEQLKPELFEAACQQAKVNLNLQRREGYDHSYYFIASFIEDHLRFHAALFNQLK